MDPNMLSSQKWVHNDRKLFGRKIANDCQLVMERWSPLPQNIWKNRLNQHFTVSWCKCAIVTINFTQNRGFSMKR
jgi:hypothetical protein